MGVGGQASQTRLGTWPSGSDGGAQGFIGRGRQRASPPGGTAGRAQTCWCCWRAASGLCSSASSEGNICTWGPACGMRRWSVSPPAVGTLQVHKGVASLARLVNTKTWPVGLLRDIFGLIVSTKATCLNQNKRFDEKSLFFII